MWAKYSYTVYVASAGIDKYVEMAASLSVSLSTLSRQKFELTATICIQECLGPLVNCSGYSDIMGASCFTQKIRTHSISPLSYTLPKSNQEIVPLGSGLIWSTKRVVLQVTVLCQLQTDWLGRLDDRSWWWLCRLLPRKLWGGPPHTFLNYCTYYGGVSQVEPPKTHSAMLCTHQVLLYIPHTLWTR